MSDTHNAEGRRGSRQHDPRHEAVAVDPALAQGTAQDREEVKRQQDEANKQREEALVQAEEKSKQRRAETHEESVKRQEEEFKRGEELADKQREAAKKRREDEARRAALSPAQRYEEDEKIAAMTPDERAKHFLETGRTIPLEQEGGVINPLAGPTYPVLQQHQAPTEFILSEANGQRSRGNAYLAHPVTVYSGNLLKETAPMTQLMPPTYTLAAAGADADAIALYGGTSTDAATGLRISVIVRDAEVNKHCITWTPLAGAEIDAAIAQLATKGIICR